MKSAFLILGLILSTLLVSCQTTATTQESSKLKGRVQRANGKPVSNVSIVAVEERDRTFDVYPMSDKEMAKTKTDKNGEYELSLPAETNLKRLMVSALAEEEKKQIAPNQFEMILNDVVIKSPSFDKLNIIVVPNDFKPALSDK